jgi:hypothetical protein
MDPMAIIGIAVGVGAIVYALSLRTGAEEALPVHPVDDVPGPVSEPAGRRLGRQARGRADALGFSSSDVSEPDVGSPVYVPVLPSPGPGWRERLAGLIGLVAIVVVAAAILAIGVYQVGHMANEMIERFLGR